MSLCMCEHMCAGTHGGQGRAEEGVSCPAWVLGAEPRVSIRAARSHTHWIVLFPARSFFLLLSLGFL